jgi:hypothetical protein
MTRAGEDDPLAGFWLGNLDDKNKVDADFLDQVRTNLLGSPSILRPRQETSRR